MNVVAAMLMSAPHRDLYIVNPFSAKAVGLTRKDIISYHNLPFKTLGRRLSEDSGYTVYHEYLSNKTESKYFSKYVIYNFYKCRRYGSFKLETAISQCLVHGVYNRGLYIINQTGNGTKQGFWLGKTLNLVGNSYIAVVAGNSISQASSNMAYLKNARFIVVHNEQARDELNQKNELKDAKIVKIPLCASPAKANRRIACDRLRLLTVARITPLKNIEAVLRLVKKVHDEGTEVQLAVVGPVSDASYMSLLMSMVVNYGITDLVRFVGALSPEAVRSYMVASDALVHLSKNESFGIVGAEAMACGLPVIWREETPGISEYIVNGKNGMLFNKKNIISVVNFLSNREQLRAAGDAARKTADEYFSEDRFYRDFSSLINVIA